MEEENFSREQSFNLNDDDLTAMASYRIFKPSELETIRNKVIEEFQEFLGLSRDETIIALVSYKWKESKIKDEWYDNDTRAVNCGIEESDIIKEKVELKNGDACRICETPFSETEAYAMKCQHRFCLDCWKGVCEEKLSNVNNLMTSLCPMEGCNLVIRETVFYRFVSPELQTQLKKIILKNFTDANLDIKWCPSPECNTCFQTTTGKNKEIVCETCQESICFMCGKESHRPSPCEVIEFWEKRSGDNIEHIKWLLENTKKCPKCKKHVEKNGGCNHMTCQKKAGGCGHEYCWICLGDWKSHSDFYNCNKLEKSAIEKMEKEKKMTLEGFKLRFDFYFKRITNHKKAKDFILKIKAKLGDFYNNLCVNKKITYDNCLFLNSAVDSLLEVKKTLTNSYIYSYVILEKKDRGMTEHNLWILERECERLLSLVESKKMEKLLKITDLDQFMKEFQQFKENIINLTNIMMKFHKTLLAEIENNLLNTKLSMLDV